MVPNATTSTGNMPILDTRRAPLWYSLIKLAILVLLVLDAGIYASGDRPSAGLDAIAWLVLLLLFELETELGARWRASRFASVVHVIRAAAILAIGSAALAFLQESAWLDAANSVLWIAVVLLLEFEVRFPRIVAHRPRLFQAAATALYSGLGGLVIVWAGRDEWLDAYDALLWLLAFAVIEMDMLRFSRRSAAEDEEPMCPEQCASCDPTETRQG